MNIDSKLSLYDTLTMLVSGFFLLAIFVPFPNAASGWCVYSAISYFVGIVYHRILEKIRGCEKIHKWYLGDKMKTIFCRNHPAAIEKAKEFVFGNHSEKTIVKDYYHAYYEIMDKPCYVNIRLLEAQEAFLRDAFVILVIYAFIFLFTSEFPLGCLFYPKISEFQFKINCGIRLSVVIFVGIFFCLFVRYQTQMKIYELVWEGVKYTHDVNNCGCSENVAKENL